MGRYDFPCDGSESEFFSSGVMNAALNCIGNTPTDSDLLNTSVKNCASAYTVLKKTHWNGVGGALLVRKLVDGGDNMVNRESVECQELTARWNRDERWCRSAGSRCTHSVDLFEESM